MTSLVVLYCLISFMYMLCRGAIAFGDYKPIKYRYLVRDMFIWPYMFVKHIVKNW